MRNIYEYPATEEGKKIAIWGVDDRAVEIAISMLNRNARFEYFVFPREEKIKETYLMNKKIINVCEGKFKDIIIYADNKYDMHLENIIKKYELMPAVQYKRIDNELCNNELIIYGAGKNAEIFLDTYGSALDVEVCDGDSDKWGRDICGYKVKNPDELLGNIDGKKILIFCSQYQEIEKYLRKMGVSDCDIYVDKELYFYKGRIELLRNKVFWGSKTIHSIPYGIYDMSLKNVILYGYTLIVKSMEKKLDLLDLHNYESIYRSTVNEDGTLLHVLDDSKNEVCVILDGYSKSTLDMLLKEGHDIRKYRWIDNYSPYYTIDWDANYRKVYDPLLGYITKSADSRYAGIIEYQWRKNEDDRRIKILILGNSTSTAHWTQSSWAESLSEILRDELIPHIIFCAGIEAYNSTQELLFLIRDGIILEPDIVICMDGINELNWMKISKHPFYHKFYEKICHTVSNNKVLKKELGSSFDLTDVNYGIESKKNNILLWYDNIRMMSAICAIRGIAFLAFLQPNILIKKHYLQDRCCMSLFGVFEKKDSTGLLMLKDGDVYSEHIENHKRSQEMCGELIYDLSTVLDSYDMCYIDLCHMNNLGNSIIAQKIFLELKEYITGRENE